MRASSGTYSAVRRRKPPQQSYHTPGGGGVKLATGNSEMKKLSLAEKLESYQNERQTFDVLRMEKRDVPASTEELIEHVSVSFKKIMARSRIDLGSMFKTLDKDGDGTVTAEEFRTGFKKLRIEFPPERVDELINYVDRDGDGEIDYKEFIKQFKDQKTHTQPSKSLGRGQPEATDTFTHADALLARKGLLLPVRLRSGLYIKHMVKWTYMCDVFNGLTKEQRYTLCANCEGQSCAAGTTVLKNGDALSGIGVVFSGACSIMLPKTQQKAKDFTNQVLEEGQKLRASKSIQKWLQAGRNKIKEAAREKGGKMWEKWKLDVAKDAGVAWRVTTRRRAEEKAAAVSAEKAVELVEVEFGPQASFGEMRAFHNVSSSAVMNKGYQTVMTTVTAKKDSDIMLVVRLEDVSMLKAVYHASLSEKFKFLRALECFQRCDPANVKLMAQFSRRCSFGPNTVIVHQGDPPDMVYFVVKGRLKAVKYSRRRGDETRHKRHDYSEMSHMVLNVLSVGTAFGQLGVLTQQPRAACIESMEEDVEVIVMHGHNFLSMIDAESLQMLKTKAQKFLTMKPEMASQDKGVQNMLTGRRVKVAGSESVSFKALKRERGKGTGGAVLPRIPAIRPGEHPGEEAAGSHRGSAHERGSAHMGSVAVPPTSTRSPRDAPSQLRRKLQGEDRTPRDSRDRSSHRERRGSDRDHDRPRDRDRDRNRKRDHREHREHRDRRDRPRDHDRGKRFTTPNSAREKPSEELTLPMLQLSARGSDTRERTRYGDRHR